MVNPKDVVARLVTGFHEAVFRVSNGRIGNKGFGMPVVMLTTTGRKSGKRRTTMLTSPTQDGEGIVLVASYGGDDRHPAWFLNLRDNPEVEVTMRGQTRPMRARVASSEEKAELWPRVVAAYRGYGQYQKRTERDIPLVIVEP
ncbi:MAG: nitroreductase family deazaflavin-dependent oxidoreductase [Acidimicrobiia bacterium]